jgi:hypothetical protein
MSEQIGRYIRVAKLIIWRVEIVSGIGVNGREESEICLNVFSGK